MKRNLLQIVQSVIRSLDLDPVNDVNDTPEAIQIADLARDVYEEISVNQDWAYKRTMTALSPSSDPDRPTHMKLPDNLVLLHWVNYNKKKNASEKDRYEKVQYLYPDEFIRKANGQNTDNEHIKVVTDYSGVPFSIRTDQAPTYWTSFDDEFVVFDSYEQKSGATLVGARTQVYGSFIRPWSYDQSFIPHMPADVFPHYLAELKSVCSVVLKQVTNEKFEQQSRRQRTWLYQRNANVNQGHRFPNYGRKSKIGRKYPHKLPQ